jgi:hypothetical protein
MTTQPIEAPEAPETTPNNVTAFPVDHLYIKSPKETQTSVLAEFATVRVGYQSSEDETERAYRHRTGVPDPTPPLGQEQDAPDVAPAPPVADAPDEAVEVEVTVTPKKKSSKK